MRTNCRNGRAGAFSLLELLCVMAIIGVLAALLLPALNQAKARAQRVACISNLHEVGIGFQSFAQDHNGLFPMQVPAAAGGALEFAQRAYSLNGQSFFAFRQFQPLSNELVTPKLLVCPADHRGPAPSFALLQNSNVSYFMAVTAEYGRPNSLLAGDGNLTNDWMGGATMLRLAPSSPLHWNRELHHFKGNLLFADGRVAQRDNLAMPSGGAGQTALLLPTLRMPASPSVGGNRWPSGVASPPPAYDETEPSIAIPPLPREVGFSTRAAQVAVGPGPIATNSPKTGPNAATSRPSSPTSAPPSPDPGFSLLPSWIGPLASLAANLTAASWYLGLLLLVLALAWARKRLQPKRTHDELCSTETPRERGP